MKHVKFYHGSNTVLSNSTIISIPNENQVYFLDEKTKKHGPRATICGIYDDEKNIINFGAARCSEKDRFIKTIGRALSEERAIHHPNLTVKCNNKKDFSDLFIKNAKNLYLLYVTQVHPINI